MAETVVTHHLFEHLLKIEVGCFCYWWRSWGKVNLGHGPKIVVVVSGVVVVVVGIDEDWVRINFVVVATVAVVEKLKKSWVQTKKN